MKPSRSLEPLDSADPPLAVHRLHAWPSSPTSSPWRTGSTPPAWVTYSPLLPLALLLFTGLYLFVLPYATRWRSGQSRDRVVE